MLGRAYSEGEIVVQQGDVGDCMFVIQEGEVEVVRNEGGRETRLTVLRPGDFFGEMALVDREVRSATVRAIGPARILTVDKRTFLRRIQEDPSLALNVLKAMSGRIRRLNAQIGESRACALEREE